MDCHLQRPQLGRTHKTPTTATATPGFTGFFKSGLYVLPRTPSTSGERPKNLNRTSKSCSGDFHPGRWISGITNAFPSKENSSWSTSLSHFATFLASTEKKTVPSPPVKLGSKQAAPEPLQLGFLAENSR
ncbi:hypothetical protein C5167_039380 [Papaver somniferum]|uniref:Uncharacterized protein n=1 Tax=Papaver somniferum TaxID=3469 RepID=A0A4Y7IFG2_PAPSO|nr:hypothetical protein C5167_039380 [Papaver somniferum]